MVAVIIISIVIDIIIVVFVIIIIILKENFATSNLRWRPIQVFHFHPFTVVGAINIIVVIIIVVDVIILKI